MPNAKSLADRLWAAFKVMPSGCWEWQLARPHGGYGQVNINRVSVRAHRAVFELAIGPIPDGFVLDHLCGNPPCVNPSHMNVTTQRDNVLRSETARAAINARKTHCLHGHELTGDNLYQRPDGRGRACKACLHAATRRHRAREKTQARHVRVNAEEV